MQLVYPSKALKLLVRKGLCYPGRASTISKSEARLAISHVWIKEGLEVLTLQQLLVSSSLAFAAGGGASSKEAKGSQCLSESLRRNRRLSGPLALTEPWGGSTVLQ